MASFAANAPRLERIIQQSDVQEVLQHDGLWYKKKNLRALYSVLLPAALGVEMAAGYDGSMTNGLQSVAVWLGYFGHPSGAVLGLITAAFAIGSVIALPTVPYANDHYGRKPSIIIGCLIMLIGVALQAGSVHIAMFFVARLLLGIGIVFGVGGASQLLAELVHPNDRAVCIGLFSESWYAGAIVAAGVTLGSFNMSSTWSWRIPSLLQLIPTFITLTFIWWVPESPRWLVAHGHEEEALRILTLYHGEGNPDNALVRAQMFEIKNMIKGDNGSSMGSWADLLRTRGNQHRSLIALCAGLFLEWSGNGLFAYYLAKVLSTAGVTSPYTQNVINVGLQCWNLLTGVTGAFCTQFFGRRQQYLIAYAGMTLVFTSYTMSAALYVETGSVHAAISAVAMVFVYAPIYNLMMPLTYIYVTEIFPYSLRAKGVAITQTATRGSTAFNQFVNPIGMQNLGWKFFLVYCVWTAIETIIIFYIYPETKGPTLEEVALVFDGLHIKPSDPEIVGGDLEMKSEESS
ncbi:general substrate transporter [Dacryopinax primogenitus]|uniref:General substrate transporter n=1 Tax=Dacryopinax primogenitus (strain DJM 731) TaxID=1858805 RepID=M5FYG2_DACPD|nr:general substrate transporter [Dacryopinax primogenitus]EJT96557.1 general substrate transporter [Dacryopinax primogenitus]